MGCELRGRAERPGRKAVRRRQRRSHRRPAVTGTGDLTAASKEVTAVTGAFNEGEEISGAGIPTGTKVEKVEEGGNKLILTEAATEAGTGVALAVLVPYRVTFQGALSQDSLSLLTNPGLSEDGLRNTL